MAEYYVSALAGGTGVGSEGDPWTLAQANADVVANTTWVKGDTLWIKADGIYQTAGLVWTNMGTNAGVYKFAHIRGYSTVTGDRGQATIQSTGGGLTIWHGTQGYVHYENLIFDGVDNSCHGFIQSGYTFTINCKAINCNRGFSTAYYHNCHAEDCTVGFYICSTWYCFSKNNGTNYFRTISTFCVSKNGVNGFDAGNYGSYMTNCIIDGASAYGSDANRYGFEIGCIYTNNAQAQYLVSGNPYTDRNNYYQNNVLSTQDPPDFREYWELDPQYTNRVLDNFTRTGSNLNDKLTKIGNFNDSLNYAIDLGIFQGLTPTYADVSDVRDGTDRGDGVNGTLDLPSINDVERGVQFDNTTKEGTFKSPAEADVRLNSQYGTNGTEYEGSLDLPSIDDVEKDVVFDNTTKTGTFEAPVEADVRDGTFYGANGTQYEGHLAVGTEVHNYVQLDIDTDPIYITVEVD